MGEVIRKTADVDDILADLEATYARARAREGVFAELAESRLASILALIAPLASELRDATDAADAVGVVLAAADQEADAVVGVVADRIWNAIGRPTRDPGYDVLFPGGNAYYVGGDVDEQPRKIRMLVGLLRRNVHPRLPPAIAADAALELDAAADRLGAAVEAAREPRARLALVARTRSALARTAAIELSDFKRLLKASGMSESEIHAVIPDRPKARPSEAPPAIRTSIG